MKISFLVTYYQQKKYIAQSMESLLALEKPGEWEILIGDDGSTDGSIELEKEYVRRDPEHIRLFVMPRDPDKTYTAVERAGANRLNLVRQAAGDYYCIIDGDDFYSETDFLPEAVRVLEAQPQVTVVAFDTWTWREGEPKRAKKAGSHTPVPEKREMYLRWHYTHAGACVYRRSIHTPENLALLEKLNFFDDNEIILNALAAGEMVRIHRPVYAYRQEDTSLYHSISPSERAALNVAGMGTALGTMGGKWRKDLTARYATAVIMAWLLRKRLRADIRPDRFETYLSICRRADFEEGIQLLNWPDLDAGGRKRIRRFVAGACLASPPRVLYALTQVHGGGEKT